MILLVLIFLIVAIIVIKWRPFKSSTKGSPKFYSVDQVYPELNGIYPYLEDIQRELQTNLLSSKWTDWPERELYFKDGSWKIFPFKGFDITVESHCQRFPRLWEFIQSLPKVKLAILSKLSPGMKLHPHQGWGKHSNGVLRAHFGLRVPPNCYLSVADDEQGTNGERQYHQPNEWLVFDDSKYHYAENGSDEDRVVLILDLERPAHIPPGTSTAEETSELKEFLKFFQES